MKNTPAHVIQNKPSRVIQNKPSCIRDIETFVAEDYLSAPKHHTPYPLLSFTFNLSGKYEKKDKTENITEIKEFSWLAQNDLKEPGSWRYVAVF